MDPETKKPLSPEDVRLLEEELKNLEPEWIGRVLGAVLLAAVFVLLPMRRAPSMAERFGFGPSVLMGTLLLIAFYTFRNNRGRKALQADLKAGVKRVARLEVLRKERSYGRKTFTVWLDGGSRWQKLHLTEEQYAAAEVGRLAELEYGANSGMLFSIKFLNS